MGNMLINFLCPGRDEKIEINLTPVCYSSQFSKILEKLFYWKIGQFKYIRIISDFICVVIGTSLFLFADGTFIELLAIVGIGTIITASCMGPLIDFFTRKIAQPFLER